MARLAVEGGVTVNGRDGPHRAHCGTGANTSAAREARGNSHRLYDGTSFIHTPVFSQEVDPMLKSCLA